MVEEITTKSFEETQAFAEKFASRLVRGDIVLLSGNLGAGKTTFVQGLARGMGINHRIISPTFIVLRTYEIPNVIVSSSNSLTINSTKQSKSETEIATSQAPRNDKGSSSHDVQTIKSFYHVDLYRLQTEKEIEGIGLTDLMGKKDNIVVIEWPEKLGSLLPKNAWKMSFESVNENERKITIEKI